MSSVVVTREACAAFRERAVAQRLCAGLIQRCHDCDERIVCEKKRMVRSRRASTVWNVLGQKWSDRTGIEA